jgi:Flp pilus assembly protein TadD
MSEDLWSSEEYDREAQHLYEAGDYEGALELLHEGLTLYPSSGGLHVSMGYAQLARQEYLWARQSFERALVLEPDHEEALLGLGEALLKFGERSRALGSFERLVELGFDADVQLMISAGRSLYREGMNAQAERFFRMAVKADLQSADAAAELAYVLHARDETEEARGWLERALELDPSHHEARTFLAHLIYESGGYEEALAELRSVPVHELWDPLAVWRIIELLRGYEGLGPDSAELEPYLQRMEELNPEPRPEDRLLAEVEAAAESGELPELPELPRDENQLELFVPERTSRGEEFARHRVRTLDGRTYEGTWPEIVRALRDDGPDPGQTLGEFMRDFGRRVENVTGIRIPVEDPAAFIRGAVHAGMLLVEE